MALGPFDTDKRSGRFKYSQLKGSDSPGEGKWKDGKAQKEDQSSSSPTPGVDENLQGAQRLSIRIRIHILLLARTIWLRRLSVDPRTTKSL
jgi:hypothetical protein